ncbi:HD domain-containing protein [Proteus mirabilis]|uniref:HD domain-containing protein n=1 Tax=Proteus mirabilis TaxID=584 RepID=UPI0039B46445
MKSDETRYELERDFDRILFCAPIRRLADKTQVFPLEKNDSVRTRLTHSYEVSNLARSIGTKLAYNDEIDIFDDYKKNGGDNLKRNLPAILAAIGLAHDLGNPPFGHRGEKAMSLWFRNKYNEIIDNISNNEREKKIYRK